MIAFYLKIVNKISPFQKKIYFYLKQKRPHSLLPYRTPDAYETEHFNKHQEF